MRVILCMAALLFSSLGQAAVVRDLYQVAVPVADQTQASRKPAVRAAFDAVVVKVSGTRDSLTNPAIAAAADSAETLISSLRYERDPASGELRLEVGFMETPVQAMLEQSGAPVWGASRPQTALWLVEDTGSGRNAVSPENLNWAQALRAAMRTRGVPLLLPSWDLEDDMALPLARLWGLFEQDIAAAAQRYPADAYLAGRILGNDQALSFAGYLQSGTERTPVQLSAADAAGLAAAIADMLAEQYSDRYAVVALPQELAAGGQVIRVSGVDGFSAYRRLIDYLGAHVAIRGLRVLRVSGSEVTLSVDTASSWTQAWDVLALDKKLTVAEGADTYVWLP